MFEEKRVTEQAVLGQNGENLPDEIIREIAENLDKKSLLSLSATSQSAALFFKPKIAEIKKDAKIKWEKIEERRLKEYGAIFEKVDVNPNPDFNYSKKAFIGILFGLSLSTGTISGLTWRGNPEVGVSFGVASASTLLILACFVASKSLLSCKDILFAQKKIIIAREVRQALESSDELTLSVSEEDESGNDNDNRGSLNYGTINYDFTTASQGSAITSSLRL